MLAPTYRFTILNSTGQTLAANAVTIKPRRWKFASDGSTTQEASGTADVLAQSATVVTGAYRNGTTQNNTVDKYIAGHFEVTVTAPVSSNGDVHIYLDTSVDGGTTWPDNGLGQWVGTLSFTTSGTKRRTIEVL